MAKVHFYKTTWNYISKCHYFHSYCPETQECHTVNFCVEVGWGGGVEVNKIEKICTKQHGLTSQKTIIFIVIAVRTSDSKNLIHNFEGLVILKEKWITDNPQVAFLHY